MDLTQVSSSRTASAPAPASSPLFDERPFLARKSENSIVSPSAPGTCSGAELPIVPFTGTVAAWLPVIG